VLPHDSSCIACSADSKKSERSIVDNIVQGGRREVRRFGEDIREGAKPRFVPLPRELPRRYRELGGEAYDALGAEVAPQEAGRLTLAPFGSAKPSILIPDERCRARHPGAQFLRSNFSAQQIRTDQWIAQKLPVVAQMTKEVLNGDVPSRLGVCVRRRGPPIGPRDCLSQAASPSL
jgi:hypothetical protein